MSAKISISSATTADLAAIQKLHGTVFGPGRFARSAYRIREGAPSLSRYCHVATTAAGIIGAVHFTDLCIGGKDGAILLGPIAIAASFTGQGIGHQLIDAGLAQARQHGRRLVILIGDPGYFSRHGFQAIAKDQIVIPGPHDPARLLALELAPGALGDYHGAVAACN